MLDDRKSAILRAVVQQYISTAQPVGSSTVAARHDVAVSSATVRNDMTVLEREGYLVQPHTSAGRIPTEKGYRFFVDQLGPGRLGASETQQVRSFFARAHGEIEQMLADTTRLLSNLTRYAAVVVGPPHEVATVRSVQLVQLTQRVVLCVVVLSNGAVEKHTIETDLDLDDLLISAAGTRLAGAAIGRSLAEVVAMTLPDISTAGGPRSDVARPDVDRLLGLTLDALRGDHRHEDQVFIGGTSEMVSAFDAVGTVSEILRILEQQLLVVNLLEDVLGRGLSVAIGRETGNEALADCSLVVAPYVVDGEAAGAIGVLGPTRMHYDQALSAVAVVANRLGRRLSEG